MDGMDLKEVCVRAWVTWKLDGIDMEVEGLALCDFDFST